MSSTYCENSDVSRKPTICIVVVFGVKWHFLLNLKVSRLEQLWWMCLWEMKKKKKMSLWTFKISIRLSTNSQTLYGPLVNKQFACKRIKKANNKWHFAYLIYTLTCTPPPHGHCRGSISHLGWLRDQRTQKNQENTRARAHTHICSFADSCWACKKHIHTEWSAARTWWEK